MFLFLDREQGRLAKPLSAHHATTFLRDRYIAARVAVAVIVIVIGLRPNRKKPDDEWKN
ncbi:hypothetical protein [Paraburkholderia sp. BL25I1N1]|uniref:hypothetical protein n=1 Tax=Paraburkholderia sp. BL25I1N1 TaxID=1938804 RepID=UPI0015E5EB67|nr:hypothetical protein [Paraburkholderia sp. BL25I1N1]